MKVLLVGNGGREHAIARALVRTSTPEHPVSLVVQAGNPALEQLGRSLTMDPLDPKDVVRRATSENVDLVVVGPEAPLVAGVADAVLDYGIPVFGPTKDAARLEASKSFAKQVMADAGVAPARAFPCTPMDAAGADTTIAPTPPARRPPPPHQPPARPQSSTRAPAPPQQRPPPAPVALRPAPHAPPARTPLPLPPPPTHSCLPALHRL